MIVCNMLTFLATHVIYLSQRLFIIFVRDVPCLSIITNDNNNDMCEFKMMMEKRGYINSSFFMFRQKSMRRRAEDGSKIPHHIE